MKRAFRRLEGRLTSPLRVLIYHRVGGATCDPWAIAVSPANFEAQVAELVAGGDVVPLDKALIANRRRVPGRERPQFAITFDDGYADNLTEALPVLEHFDAPATVFIASRYIGQRYFWWDRVAEIVHESSRDMSKLMNAASRSGLIENKVAEDVAGESSAKVIRTFYEALLGRSFDEQLGLLDELGRALSLTIGADSPRPLTAEELRLLRDHPLITIGAHTDTHQRLTKIPPGEAYRDVVNGDARLDEVLGPQHRLFAYPNGHMNKQVARVVKRAGFKYAFTTESRPISLLDRPLMLPRISTADIDGPEFAVRRGLRR